MTKVKNAFYAQSGGVTAVINASACGVIETVNKSKKIHKVLAGENGILGALNEELIDTSKESKNNIAKLKQTPGGAFGSCRFKLQDPIKQRKEYERLFEVFAAHDIEYFFYNGGGDSQDTTLKISEMAKKLKFPLKCVGIPKTVDNDLPYTDCSPGFGSVAKYVINSTIEAALDVESMAASSTKVFILEVMGRHAGWIAASSAVAIESYPHAPDLILLPEITFKERDFLRRVKDTVASKGFCVVVASEGIKNNKGRFIAESGLKDAFGHSQLGGVAPTLANIISKKTGLKNHWAVADYLQRSARHIASGVDLDQAFAVGKHAVKYASKNMHGVMPVIKRLSNNPYKWTIEPASLKKIANVEKKLPASFITKDGYGITKKGIAYFKPLISGKLEHKFSSMPKYIKGKLKLVKKKLPLWV